MEGLIQDLQSRGMVAVQDLIKQRREETLHLEFKTLSSRPGEINRDDKTLIAKAVCGMSNAEGGTILIGVETEKDDGIDVATGLRPIENVATFRNRLVSLLPELLSLPHPGVTTHLIPKRGQAGTGLVAIEVPPSDRRPHMSTADHRYHRRGSQGTRVMEHGEIRDLMFAPREGVLELETRVSLASQSGIKIFFHISFWLRNVGQVAVRAPYLKAGRGMDRAKHEACEIRQLPEGWTGFYTGRDTLVHVSDEMVMAQMLVGLILPPYGQSTAHTISLLLQYDQQNEYFIAPHHFFQGQFEHKDKPIGAKLIYGGENARTAETEFNPTKRETLELFAGAVKTD